MTQADFLRFLGVTGAVWGAAHLYVGARMIHPLRLSRTTRWGLWLLVLLLWSLAPMTMVLGRMKIWKGSELDALAWIGFTYMGLFLMVFPLTFFRDAVLGAVFVWRWLRRNRFKIHPELENPDRRRFVANATHAGVLGVSGVLGGVGFHQARKLPDVVEVNVPIRGLSELFHGYKIVQLSDVHIGPTIKGNYLRSIVDIVNELEPDVIALTGDFVDGYVHDLRSQVASLADLKARDGVFFITGNHEYYWKAEEWEQEFRRLGIRVLNNDHHPIQRGEEVLLMAGVTDFSAGRYIPSHASSCERALEGAPPSNAKVLLAHQPRSIFAAAEAGFDLQLSGHTHGGQFFPWNLFIGLAHPFSRGLHQFGRTWIYVSCGTGYWGPPFRTLVPSEIALVRLSSSDHKAWSKKG